MKSDARIHYSIIDGGGFSPNVVQPTASVLYMVRSPLVGDALELQTRVDKIAEGASLMSECSYEKMFIDGCSGTVTNHTLENAIYANMKLLPIPEYTDGEWEFARSIKSTYKTYSLPTIAAEHSPEARAEVERLTESNTRAINDFLSPLYLGDTFSPGSTDVGDVSWQTPTAQLYSSCFIAGAPGHSWQNVSVGRTSIAHKGMLYAAKALAMTAIDLFEDAELLAKAREEFSERTKNGYVCPIPENEHAKPVEL